MGVIQHNYTKGQMIAIGFVFITFPIVAVSLRVWAKFLNRGRLFLDDYLCFAALGFAIGCSVCQLVAAFKGQLGQHQANDAHGLPILDDPRFLIYERCKFALQMLSTLSFGCAKASIIVMYMNIFTVRWFKYVSQAMLCIVGAWVTSFFFAYLFTCFPVTALVEAFYGNKCVNTIAMWYAGGYSDIVLDGILLILPIPLTLKLQLPLMQRIGVLAMFFTGATVVAISITRQVVFEQVGSELLTHFNDETYYTSPVFFWTVIEAGLGVFCACLPTLRPIWTHLRPEKQSAGTTRGSTYPSVGSSASRFKSLYSSKLGKYGETIDDEYDQTELTARASVNATPPESLKLEHMNTGSH